MIKCRICSDNANTKSFEWDICCWCEGRIRQFVEGNIYNNVINVYWGAGRIDWGSWWSIRDLLRKENIKEVLEFGTGLSSELFINEGIKLTSFDVLEPHVNMYKKHNAFKEVAQFNYYPYGIVPPVQELYPNKKWDYVFVDGGQERSREVRVAMEVSNKYIYLHDPNLGEQSFFPNKDWVVTNKDAKLFIKV